MNENESKSIYVIFTERHKLKIKREKRQVARQFIPNVRISNKFNGLILRTIH